MKIILLIMIGLSMVHAEFLRDATKEVVQDTSTNLMWQDDATPSRNWTKALSYCEELKLATFTDWRLPNQNELKSIVDTTVISPAISSVFQNRVSSHYWSSTTYAGGTTSAWDVHFNNGNDFINGKAGTYYVRCVR